MESLSSVSTSIILPLGTPFHHHHHHRRRLNLRSHSFSTSCRYPDHLRTSRSSFVNVSISAANPRLKLFGSRIDVGISKLNAVGKQGGNEGDDDEDEVEKALRLDGTIPGSSNEFVEQVSSRAYDMCRHLQQMVDSSSYDGIICS
ncbi:hypothetical protein QVD17_01680 [Tagetes erecta]|uniref:Uncharacterized protein n=1 Tax=Tagetes erecta TaxID=13708 RepID=A0AAD8L6U1_TARER|nr:hypothetical protein QVD17_01680 [Tagetes erecta]